MNRQIFQLLRLLSQGGGQSPMAGPGGNPIPPQDPPGTRPSILSGGVGAGDLPAQPSWQPPPGATGMGGNLPPGGGNPQTGQQSDGSVQATPAGQGGFGQRFMQALHQAYGQRNPMQSPTGQMPAVSTTGGLNLGTLMPQLMRAGMSPQQIQQLVAALLKGQSPQ